MQNTDFSSPRTTPTDSVSPLYYGRAETVTAILEALASNRDVIVEAEPGLGKSMLRATVARAARVEGWRTIRLDQPSPMSSKDPAIVIADLDALSATDLSRLADLQRSDGVRFFATRRPPHPFAAPTDSTARTPVLARATTMTLLPLTLTQCDALIEEQVSVTPMHAEPTLVERRWVWAQSGGFPRVAVSLLHTLNDSPVEEDSLSTPSRRTLIEASGVLAGLPPALQRFASSLLPLVGVSFTRIRRFFNRVELSLLIESHVISDHRDTLCIPLPFQSALRMMSEPEMTALAQDIIADICASVVIDAECSESEVNVAARALTVDATLRALIDSDAQLAVLSMAMWLARRRGESEPAAAIARRILTMHPAAATDGLRRIARQESDDFERLAADLRAGQKIPVADLCLWALCLQMPLTATVAGLDDLLAEIGEQQSDTIDRYGLEAHRASLVAAGALDLGDFDEALRLTAPLLVPSHRNTLAALRGYSVNALVHARRLDHAALRTTAEAFAQLATATTFERGLKADLTRRMTLDALTVITCAFGAAGQRVPISFEQVIDRFITEGLLHEDLSMSTAAAICHLIISAQHDQQDEMQGDIRFLTRQARTDVSAWVLAAVGGHQPEPLFSPVTSALSQAVTLALALTIELQRGQVAFSDAISALPDASVPLVKLAQRFLTSASTGIGAGSPIDDIAGIEEATIPGAMLDFCIGIEEGDPSRLRRAAFTFQSMGGGEQAQAALTALTPLVSGDHAFEKSLRPLKRTVTSRLRAMEEKAEPLTPREYEIALLAAQGHRNAEIAQRLFLSVRTVESHLYRAMRKLAVDRDGLHPSVLLRLGIDS